MKSQAPPPFGENLKTLRLAKKLTQLELGNLVGYDGPEGGSPISLMEAGKRNPTLPTIYKLAKALGCAADLLMAGSEVPASMKG